MNSFNFWQKFSRYLSIGLSALIIIAGVQFGMVGDFTQRGPDQVLADEDTVIENPGFNAPSVPDDQQVSPAPVEQPVAPASVPSAAPAVPATPQCTPNDQIRTEQDCVGNQWCTFNIWKGTNCSEGRGGAYGCQLIPGKCGYNPTPTQVNIPVNTPVQTVSAPACPTLVNSTTCGQPSYDTCVLHYEADGRARYDCYASQNRICVGSLYCAASNTQSAQPQPSVQQCPAPGMSGTQLYCNGRVWGYDECRLTESYSDGSPKSYTCKFSGNRNNCIGSVTCPAPATSDNQARDRRGRRGPEGPQGPQGSAGPAGPAGAAGAPGAAGTSGTTTTTVQREVIREVFVEGNVGVGTSATTYYANVKQLPNTGLPALAWAVAAFVPVGFRLKGLGSVKKDAAGNPSYLWEERQFRV